MPSKPKLAAGRLEGYREKCLRQAVVLVVLAAATALGWWLIYPDDWSYTRTGPNSEWQASVRWWHDLSCLLLVTVLAAVSGWLGYWWIGSIGITVPVVCLFDYQASRAETPGANLWALALIFLLTILPLWIIGAGRSAWVLQHWLARRRSAQR